MLRRSYLTNYLDSSNNNTNKSLNESINNSNYNKNQSEYQNIINSSVNSANKLLFDIESDLFDAKEIVKQRNNNYNNLEELVDALKYENNQLKDEIKDLKGYIEELLNSINNNECTYQSELNENKLIYESEIERVIEQSRISQITINSQEKIINDLQSNKQKQDNYIIILESQNKQSKYIIDKLNNEIGIYKEKLHQMEEYNRIVSTAHEEVMEYKQDRSRNVDNKSKYENETIELKLQLKLLKQKYEDIEFENKLLKTTINKHQELNIPITATSIRQSTNNYSYYNKTVDSNSSRIDSSLDNQMSKSSSRSSIGSSYSNKERDLTDVHVNSNEIDDNILDNNISLLDLANL